ncbi:MAG: energy transducer TonB [Paracoccaceae bacterium]|nr:energy transducer TonB [Paracoccaceae bacterium]
MNSRYFEFDDLPVLDVKFTKLYNVATPKIFQVKKIRHLQNAMNHIQHREILKEKTAFQRQKMDFSNVSKISELLKLTKFNTQFLEAQNDNSLIPFRKSVSHKDEVKATNLTSIPTNAVEEPISTSWGSAIERMVLSNLVYPKKARNKFLSGKVFLKLEIFSDGTIVNVLVKRSSGHSILDMAAKAAVLRSLKLPAAPDDYPNKKYIFNLPVKFSV